jgi:WD40 repeat protein
LKNQLLMVVFIIWLFLMTACSQSPVIPANQLETKSVQAPSATLAQIKATEELATPTSVPTVEPTQTATKTEIVPALNGTPMPFISSEINANNVKDIKVLKQSSSNNQIKLLGADGSRWSVQKESVGEIHDTKTNALIWEVKAPYSFIDSNATQALIFNKDYTSFEVQYQEKKSETFEMPPLSDGKYGKTTKTIFYPIIQHRLLAIERWFKGSKGSVAKIDVYSWGETKPKYSIPGYSAKITEGEKYITYFQGTTFIFADTESGEKVTEFTFGEGETGKISWDDAYMAISRKGMLDIWKLADRKVVRTIQTQKDTFLKDDKYSFSPNNKAIMVLMPDGTLRTWSIESGEIINEEKSNEKTINHLRVSDDGEIIKFNLPEVAGSSWKTQFNYYFSQMTFAKDTESLLFSHQTFDQYDERTEICVWDLANSPACDYWEDHIFASPGKYRLFSFGSDNELYFLKSHAQPISLQQGWEEDGKVIAQIPQISRKGDIFNFKYDPGTGIIQMSDFGGKTFFFNHKTKSRLLVDGNVDRFLISIDGKRLYELVNQKKNPTVIEFVQYDSQTLKEISRTPLEKTIHPAVLDKSLLDVTPKLASIMLSPDGKKLYAYIYYESKTKKDEAHKAVFLTVPLDAVENSSISEMEFKTLQVISMLLTGSGDLAIITQTDTGDLHFIDTTTGKEVHTLHVGGNPIKLALKPDGKLLAVADIKNGIQLLGIPSD